MKWQEEDRTAVAHALIDQVKGMYLTEKEDKTIPNTCRRDRHQLVNDCAKFIYASMRTYWLVCVLEETKNLAKMGESVYQSNKDWLEKEYMGKIVALSEEGVAGVGDEILEVYEKAKKKSKGPFYFRRIGPNPSVGYLLVLF